MILKFFYNMKYNIYICIYIINKKIQIIKMEIGSEVLKFQLSSMHKN